MTFILTLQQRKEAFKRLGEYFLSSDDRLNQLISTAHHFNGWFTVQETERAVKAWGESLNQADLDAWLGSEECDVPCKKIGLVLAGNIPLVGFHDILSVLAIGHTAVIKLSSQDNVLIPHILNKLAEFEPRFQSQIQFVEKLEGFDAVIATGSNNTSRYFEYYFGKVPNVIRKNRNSVAVLSGTETSDELHKLGSDVLNFFGLGCRNVSKVYVPKGYQFDKFFESIESLKSVADNHKYNNNYDYNKSIYLVNRDEHLDNGFLLVKHDTRLTSPLAVLFYEEYSSSDELVELLNPLSENIQVIVSSQKLNTPIALVNFGESQSPRLWDYADGVNTLEFLRNL